jgi:hypothetical protein
MDGGSGINVLYTSTLDEMGIPRSALRPSTAPFHGDCFGWPRPCSMFILCVGFWINEVASDLCTFGFWIQ